MRAMENSRGNWFKDLFLIFVSGLVLYLGFAFFRPLANPDEGRYAEIPREMIASGDYITPRLNGLPYFYKPPLFYWMQCASMKAMGYNRFSIRFASSLTAVLGICMTYAAARALYGRRAGWFSAFVLATSILYYVIGLIVTLDMAVSVFMAGAMFSFIVAVKKSGIFRSVLFAAFFVFMALAVMTKGIIGILIPCAVAFLYVVSGGISSVMSFFKNIAARDWLFVLLGILAFFAITIPWHVLVSIANPATAGAEGVFSKNPDGQGFFWYYFIHEHLLRYIDPETSMRAQPFWFFLAIAPAGAIPWIFFLPRIIKNTISGGSVDARGCRNDFLYMAIWICFIVAFFSLSSSKLVPYITAIYPAFAFVVGVWGAKAWENRAKLNISVENTMLGISGIVGAVALVVAFFILKKKPIDDAVIAAGWYTVFITAAILLIVSIFAMRYARRDNAKFWRVAAFGLVVLILSINLNAGLGQRMNSERVAEYILKNRHGEKVAVAFDYGYFQDLPVWLDELPALLGEPPTEQYFGWMREKSAHADRIFPDAAALKAELEKSGKMWVVVNGRHSLAFGNFGLPLDKRILFENKHVKLFEISLENAAKSGTK